MKKNKNSEEYLGSKTWQRILRVSESDLAESTPCDACVDGYVRAACVRLKCAECRGTGVA